MTLENQKFDLIRWIASLEDEVIVGKVAELMKEAFPNDRKAKPIQTTAKSVLSDISGVTSMAELKANNFNLTSVIREQKVRKLNPGELENLIDAVNVQETIEELLAEAS